MHTSFASALPAPAWLPVNGDELQVAYQAVGGRFWQLSFAPRLLASSPGIVHWLLVLNMALGFAVSAAACRQQLPLLPNSVAAGGAYSL